MRSTIQEDLDIDLVSPLQDGIDHCPCKKLWGTRDWTLKGLKEYLTNLDLDQRLLEEKETHKKAEIGAFLLKEQFKKATAESEATRKKPGKHAILARPDRSDSEGDGAFLR